MRVRVCVGLWCEGGCEQVSIYRVSADVYHVSAHACIHSVCACSVSAECWKMYPSTHTCECINYPCTHICVCAAYMRVYTCCVCTLRMRVYTCSVCTVCLCGAGKSCRSNPHVVLFSL